MNSQQIKQSAEKYTQQIIGYRRHLHSHPETGFDLDNTREYVKTQLINMGYQPQECGKCGLVAIAGGKKPGKTFLIRADMDALPIEEQSGEDFCPAEKGRMHACGHDMHTAMLLGAAHLLKEYEDEICGTVKLMFQPAEEVLEGADDMIKAGVLENPKVDAALMIHIAMGMPFKTGTVIVCDGGVSAPAADYFEIEVQGKGCHGAMPQLGVDPVTIAAHIITALQEIHARELAMSDEAALTIGTVHAGVANNVIPDKAVIGGTMRAYDDEVRATIKTRMAEISSAIATAFRGTAEVKFTSGCPTLTNNHALSDCVSRYCKELLGNDMAFSAGELAKMSGPDAKATKATGSEDFSYVSHEVPSVMLAAAAGSTADGYSYPLHHPMVRFDETALTYGACVYAYNAMRWLEENK